MKTYKEEKNRQTDKQRARKEGRGRRKKESNLIPKYDIKHENAFQKNTRNTKIAFVILSVRQWLQFYLIMQTILYNKKTKLKMQPLDIKEKLFTLNSYFITFSVGRFVIE